MAKEECVLATSYYKQIAGELLSSHSSSILYT